jgi:hypothetical protein
MPSWKLIYTDLKSGTILGELPAQSFSFTETLNADGGFQVTMPLVNTTPTGRLTNDASAIQITSAELAPGQTGIYFERGGTLMGGGILWGVSASVAANSLTLSGGGFLSYFRHRTIKVDTVHSAVDQLNIARSFLDVAQAVGGGDIGILTSETSVSGVTRDRTYLGYERRIVAEALEQLSQVQNGFDFRFSSGYVAGAIATEFVTIFPSSGRRTSFVFELGANIQLLDFKSNGSTLTNHVDAIGGGDGEDLPIQTAQDPTGLSSRPLLETVLNLSDVTVEATLLEHAKRAITRGSEPMVQLDVLVFPDQLPVLGSYVIGDLVKVRGSYGYIDLDDSWFRITSINVSVSDDGSEESKLSLIPQGVFND